MIRGKKGKYFIDYAKRPNNDVLWLKGEGGGIMYTT